MDISRRTLRQRLRDRRAARQARKSQRRPWYTRLGDGIENAQDVL